MTKFNDRLRELRASKKLSQQKLADFLKISKSSINMYERGEREPGLASIEAIADFFNVDIDYLLGKNDIKNRAIEAHIEKSNVIGSTNNSIYNIPVFATVSAGFGSYADSQILGYIPVELNCRSEAIDTIGIRVSGDSMYPKIEDGDIVVVRKVESVESGSIAVVIIDGEAGFVKKIEYGKNWIDLISINPEYKTKRFENAEVVRIRVVGKVVGSHKKFD